MFMWVPGYFSISGSEQADSVACQMAHQSSAATPADALRVTGLPSMAHEGAGG